MDALELVVMTKARAQVENVMLNGTPVTVRVMETPTRGTDEGEVSFPDEPVYYEVTSVAYDKDRDEWVLTISDEPVPGRCTFTMSHTRDWCGNPRCRES